MKKWAVLGLALLFGTALVGAPSPAGAELKVGVSGYVKLDIQYSDKITGSFPSPAPGDTPLDTDKERDNSQTILDVRQTRLLVTFSDEVAGVKMSGRIETDFFTGDGNALVSNSRHLRLRHAFARADHPSGFFILAGQTWTLFMNDEIAQPPLVDFNGFAGQVFNREPQLRVGFKSPLGGGMGDLVLEASVEKHGLQNLGSAAVNEAQGEGQDVPLFVGKVSWLSKIVQVEAAGAIGRNRVILTGGEDATETAWAGQVSAQVNLNPVTVFGHYQHNDGLGRLLNGDFRSAVLIGTEVENVESDGFYVGASLALTKDTSLNAAYGWADADEIPGVFTGTSLETHQSIHVNVIHKFWGRWQAGLEYRRFDVEAFDGTEGDVNFVHGALWFSF